MFQKSCKLDYNAFNISHYKTLKQYLSICGVNPYQENRISNILIIVIIFVSLIFFGLTVRGMHVISLFNNFKDVIFNYNTIFKVVIIKKLHKNKKKVNNKANNQIILLYGWNSRFDRLCSYVMPYVTKILISSRIYRK